MVAATKQAPILLDKKSLQLNIDRIQAGAIRDWVNDPMTKGFLANVQALLDDAVNNAITARDVKFLDRAHAFREVLELAKTHNSNTKN